MGSGNCVYEAPGVFDLDEDAIWRSSSIRRCAEETVIAAARKCPTSAITSVGTACH